jgi:hypothetical protein
LSCNRYKQLLSRYVDGEVTPRQKRELLAHLEQCPDCAAWLARVRQADVLLKEGVPEARPPNYVREAVLGALKGRQPGDAPRATTSTPTHTHTPTHTSTPNPNPANHSAGIAPPGFPRRNPHLRALRLAVAGMLLRFDLTPRHMVLAAVACMSAMLALAYWFNVLPPPWGYTRLGFEIPGESGLSVDVTPLPALSTGQGQPGALLAAPNPVRLLPAGGAHDVATDTPISIRFDQPMDRSSVERSIRIDPPAAGTFVWDADNEVSFTPTSPGLVRGVTYTVEISNTARSLAGTPLGEPVRWSFHTVRPHSVSATPSALVTSTAMIPTHVSPVVAVPLTASFTLTFDVPMDTTDTGTKIWLRTEQGGVWQDLPVTLTWSSDGRSLTLSPASPMPEGMVYVGVASTAHTRSGDTLGQAAEFSYRVALPVPRLRLTGGQGRVVLAPAAHISASPVTHTLTLSYEAASWPGGPAIQGVTFTVYSFPAERLSELGAQARSWPLALPAGLPAALTRIHDVQVALTQEPQTHTGHAAVPALPSGIYLVVASATMAGTAQSLSDWQLLLVGDRYLAQAGQGGPFWATDETGRAWPGAEVSLYSPEGTLLEKGLTDQWGLWAPTGRGAGATLAVVRDVSGHLAAMVLEPGTAASASASASATARSGAGGDAGAEAPLNAVLQTDLPSYLPGQQVNFRVLLHPGSILMPEGRPAATPVTEQEVSVALLTPSGSVVGRLTLKPDPVGGVSGLFNLSPQLRPGRYTIRVSAGGMQKDFPLTVSSPAQDTLSVYIMPSDQTADQTSSPVITRTVSVLDPLGHPATGAAITATLRIPGENWASEPVSAVADHDGRATVTLPLPDWLNNFNEPGLYLNVEARSAGDYGSDIQYLDYTALNAGRSGIRQLVSPSLDFAAIALPLEDGTTRLRIVSLGKSHAGDLLLIVQGPGGAEGSTRAWSLDLRGKNDITINLARNLAGGRLRFLRAGLPGQRELELMPAPPPALALQMAAPDTVAPGQQMPVRLQLVDAEGVGTTGVASVWIRRLADMAYVGQGQEQGWEPGLNLQTGRPVTATLTAPVSPGLWYVMSQASTEYGAVVRAWTVVRVLPGPVVQLPPAREARAWEALLLPVVVHNPTNRDLAADLRATDAGAGAGASEGTIKIVGGNPQPVSVAAGGWQRLDWQVLATAPGPAHIRFSFAPGAGIEGAWDFTLYAHDSPRTITTYASGLLTEQRSVGVQVPSGLSDDAVQLEIRASTSLIGTLSEVAADLAATAPYIKPGERAVLAAARLSSASVMASAYRQLGLYPPAGVQISGVEQALLLQELYSAQQPDGGWGSDVDGAGQSRLVDTANVLLALRRHSLAWAGTEAGAGGWPSIDVDMAVVNHGLVYLHNQLSRPVGTYEGAGALDSRAYGLYVLSLYGVLQPEMARPFIAYASANGPGDRLSQTGQAWLALALWQAGSTQDALALLDHLLSVLSPAGSNGPGAGQPGTQAPVLEALVLASGHDRSTYQPAAARYVRALMESRQGSGWGDPATTANALWALSRYAIQSGEQPRPGPPVIFLNDHPVQAAGEAGADRGNSTDTISVVVGGDVLAAGTNWLKLQAPTTGQTLYYSLTLKATR